MMEYFSAGRFVFLVTNLRKLGKMALTKWVSTCNVVRKDQVGADINWGNHSFEKMDSNGSFLKKCNAFI